MSIEQEKKPFRSGFIAVVGRPNVGKSTLINSLMGQKLLIMSDKPQTTRNQLLCILTNESSQMLFLDTPGIHKPKHKLGEFMVAQAQKTLRDVDLTLFVVDAMEARGPGENFILEYLANSEVPVILVVNKIDRLNGPEEVLSVIDRYAHTVPFVAVIPVSALEKTNLSKLTELIEAQLPEGPMLYPEDMVTDQPERFIAAEIIREKLLHVMREEVPHAIAVEIDEMQTRENDNVYIRGNIYVERESQKGIVIGTGGLVLKEVGRLARQEIETMVGNRVYLELWVKVRKDWRNKAGSLRSFGYGDKE